MQQELKTKLRRMLEQDKGAAYDNLYRAEAAFRGQDLTENYGASGRSKGSIIKGYRDWYEKAIADLAEFDRSNKCR